MKIEKFAKQLLASIFVLSIFQCSAIENISLAGNWRFALDRTDAGISEKWFEKNLPDEIHLPGSLPAQGIGDDITTNTPWVGGVKQSPWFTAPEYAKYRQPPNVKVPFWLQPEKYYKGVAWYQRDFEIPKNWSGKRVVLSLERPHWETSVWLDGKFIGTNDSLSTPHEYDFGQLAPGKHTLTIRVDNDMIIDIGENSHAISDHTQGDWNGVVGKIELRATPPVWLDDVQVYPNVEKKSALVKIHIGNETGKFGNGILSIGKQTESVNWDSQGGEATMEVALGDNAQLWDEFHPALQHLKIILQSPERDSREVTFGLREISTDGTQFLINGRKTFFRGTLECCVFPKTGHPPTDVADWLRVLRVAKSYGLNLIRFHSYCPPEAAFEAGDELGMYFQIETCWANQSTTIGDGKPVDDWVYRETARILKAYGNHPSFVLMPYGNEPGGENPKRGKNGNYDYHAAFNDYFAKYVSHFKSLDPRRLWTSASGWPQIPENQFDVTPDPRIQAWGAGLKSRINAKPPETMTDYRDYISRRSVPVISHEIGQWCVYPNFDEIPKYTGYLKPKNFEIFRDTLDANGMGDLAQKFLIASGKLQTLCYKEDIESALRTRGMGGFELLGINDFPGQGTALVGVLDPFWDEKGYVTAKEFHRFCNDVVPLTRLSKRVFTTDENLDAEIEIANFSSAPIKNSPTEWKLVAADGKIFARGELPAKPIRVDNGIALGHVSIDLKNAPAPEKYKLVVSLGKASRLFPFKKSFENDWNVWIYPSQLPAEPKNILVTSKFDDAAKRCLQNGGKVLLTIPGDDVRNYKTDPVKLGFSSIFWNTAWTDRQAPTTLGILCDPKNPALADFPTDYFSDWQWWYLIHRAGALRLDLLPQKVEPIVRVIDDWVTAHPLALVVEGKVGAGKIVVCGFDLTQNADDPVSRQMRASLLDYMNSKKFAPEAKFTANEISSLIAPPHSSSQTDAPIQIKGSIFKPGKSGTISVTIDGRDGGKIFDGVGAVSAGASTRLLIDYPEPERGQILNYLFKPDYGAALQILKVEIGADTDSTSGSEPSHEAVRGKIDRNLGYEWWLMKEAKARNPNIKFEALAWGAPGWVGNFWSDNNIAYTLSWLDCAKRNGFQIDYLGGGNERGYNADYYIKLRKALNEHGFSQIKIVGTEDHHPPNYWSVATEMKTNAAFAAAVDVLAEHDICGWRTPQYHCHVSADALSLGRPLWDSENSTQDYLVGADPLARVMTRHYLDGGVTGNLNWALVSSMYGSFPCAGTGTILADRPWSGFYDVGKIVWVDAHMTQFTQPGWRYLDNACGYTSGGASFTTLRDPAGKNYTTVIETVDLAAPETLAINVTGGLSDGAVQFWSTDLRSTNKADDFVHVGAIEPKNGRYQITTVPGHIYTLSTTTGQRKGDAQSLADSGSLMPLPYEENFETIRPGWPAKYFSDVHGRFEIAPCGGGRSGHCYRQIIKQEPILWHGVKMPPTTIMGDPRWWGDYEVSADAMLEGPGYVEIIGRIESQQHSAAGYHLQIADIGAWKLYTEDVAGKDRILADGTDAPFGVNHWHRLALHFVGEKIIASDDGKTLANIRDDSHTTGQIGLRVSPWQHAEFDNIKIIETAPWPQFIPHSEMTATASSEHAANDCGEIFPARDAIDDRVETAWRSEYKPLAPLPQSLTLDLGHERTVQGLACKPSLYGKNSDGNFITRYSVYLSDDGKIFQKVAAGKWKPTIATKIASWPAQKARYVRLEATKTSSGSPMIDEINIATTPFH